ncbi:hypothetical protein HNQ56_001012 [Anaerotaenia torta]
MSRIKRQEMKEHPFRSIPEAGSDGTLKRRKKQGMTTDNRSRYLLDSIT